MATETKSVSGRKGINAAAWFSQTSFISSAEQVTAKKPEPKPTRQPVEHWDGEKWITLYAEVK